MSEAQLTTEKARAQLRAILSGDTCVSPASVYDPLTARAAGRLGYSVAMLGGSVAALAVLGAPDHNLLSLDEFAGLCRRICRTGALPLMVDADHGFGNALQAMRCVEELERAGIAGMTLEDTALPRSFADEAAALIPLDEAEAKLKAALAARQSPGLVIAARTDLRLQDPALALIRARAYAAAGADALFLTGARRIEEVRAAREASGLPIMLAAAKGELAKADLAHLGVRFCLRGHATLPAATAAAWDSLAASAPAPQERPEDLMAMLSDEAGYAALIAAYLDRA
ncbi:MAG: isocitrate lyase/phosphoenolpyruvate mutase family protein [Rhodobacteraceae bacterium]|jgi:carboxyvinyl-carboxyphosphonate phosphorylmutase|nr:isocitrate lyase/phosphoenolpyruvate mutase family protein [Paracoccaceae bacterium]